MLGNAWIDVRCPMFDARKSMFDVRCSMLGNTEFASLEFGIWSFGIFPFEFCAFFFGIWFLEFFLLISILDFFAFLGRVERSTEATTERRNPDERRKRRWPQNSIPFFYESTVLMIKFAALQGYFWRKTPWYERFNEYYHYATSKNTSAQTPSLDCHLQYLYDVCGMDQRFSCEEGTGQLAVVSDAALVLDFHICDSCQQCNDAFDCRRF